MLEQKFAERCRFWNGSFSGRNSPFAGLQPWPPRTVRFSFYFASYLVPTADVPAPGPLQTRPNPQGWYISRMVHLLLQKAARATPRTGHSVTSWFRHLGATGLFFLAVVDSSPLPTFGGPDILTAILAASHRGAWYEFAAVATAGSALGAYFTYRLAQRAGAAYLNSKFKNKRVKAVLKVFERRSAGVLFASTAIPFPFPTSTLFAAAGVSNYRAGKFLTIVGVGRAIRYSAIALVADLYGRHFLRLMRHPSQYWGWSLLFIVLIIAVSVGGVLLNRRLATATASGD